MTEDSDFWDEPATGSAALALVGFAAWLLCLPFDLCARLGRSAKGDDGTDTAGADEGAWHNFHDNAGAA